MDKVNTVLRSSGRSSQGSTCGLHPKLVYGSWGEVENYGLDENMTTELNSEVQDR
jgi:hypothetical protein